MQPLITFQLFNTLDDANVVASKLEDEGIITEIVKRKTRLDAVIIGDTFGDKYEVKIAADDFNNANKILFSTPLAASDIDAGHPLRAMNDDELKEIIAKPDEWGAENYRISLSLLESRGVNIPDKVLDQLQTERTEVLAEKKSFSPFLLFVGYFMPFTPFIVNAVKGASKAGTVAWYFPGAFGLLIGLIIVISRTTLPDGRRVITYNNTVLKHGIIIVALNLLSWIINILCFLFLVL